VVKWLTRRGALLLMGLLLGGTACQPMSTPQPWVDHGVCTASTPPQPFVCQFTIHNPDTADPAHPFQWALSISNPQQIAVTPATSGALQAGSSVTIRAVIHQCPVTIHVLDVGQQAKPTLWTLHQSVCTTS
jgi:hypothetical protein